MSSKSAYLAGLQCRRRLWLTVHDPLSDEASPGRGAADEVRLGARTLFPGGVAVDDADWDAARTRTRALVANPAVPAVFDAAIEHAGVRIRVDVLERLPDGGVGIREVKAATRVKPEHLHDVAVQWYVAAGAGLRVTSVEVLHVEPGYARGADGVRFDALLRRSDVGAWTRMLLPEVATTLAAQRRLLAEPGEPAVAPSPHCFRPYDCEFWEHCTQDEPADWIMRLPWLNPDRFAELRDAGIRRIVDIPDALVPGGMHRRVRDGWRRGGVVATPELAAALASAGPPAHYLDFETLGGAVPPFAGTRPWQPVPCQWSLHHVDETGRLTHAAFLAPLDQDPRRAVAETLLAALAGTTGPVLVYSDFESRRLAELAAALPDLNAPLQAVRARLVDLLPVVREHVYAPAFGNGFSLKRVAPALAREIGYDDLDVADGADAGDALARLARGDTDGPLLRAALLAYCARDTFALVEVHRRLREIAAAPAATLSDPGPAGMRAE